jgi:hypothetical protein
MGTGLVVVLMGTGLVVLVVPQPAFSSGITIVGKIVVTVVGGAMVVPGTVVVTELPAVLGAVVAVTAGPEEPAVVVVVPAVVVVVPAVVVGGGAVVVGRVVVVMFGGAIVVVIGGVVVVGGVVAVVPGLAATVVLVLAAGTVAETVLGVVAVVAGGG